MFLRAESSKIAAVLRNRICMMQTEADDTTLHEGRIASEFGVSRTPIRQVLQKLAYERLVETRSGVGTIVSPLVPENRDRDREVLHQLFSVGASCSGTLTASRETLDGLAAITACKDLSRRGPEDYLYMRAELLDVTSAAAPDPILGDAMRAAHWRHIRWRMADQAWQADGVFDRLSAEIETFVEKARLGGLAALFEALAEADL